MDKDILVVEAHCLHDGADVADSAGVLITGDGGFQPPSDDWIGVLTMVGDGSIPHFKCEGDGNGFILSDVPLMPYQVMVQMDDGWVKCKGSFRIAIRLNPDYEGDR